MLPPHQFLHPVPGEGDGLCGGDDFTCRTVFLIRLDNPERLPPVTFGLAGSFTPAQFTNIVIAMPVPTYYPTSKIKLNYLFFMALNNQTAAHKLVLVLPRVSFPLQPTSPISSKSAIHAPFRPLSHPFTCRLS